MSIVAFYRAQCSGDCGRWLAYDCQGNPIAAEVTDPFGTPPGPVFTTWAEADEAAAKAGWHDGSQGQFAPEERKKNPWLVPLCPRCRAQT
jgi:hypothetical protein